MSVADIPEALYRWKNNQRHSSWVVLGSAVRIAQSLGMHVRTENESLLWAEQKSRIWWSLYELDQWYSCSLGRPSAITMDMNNVPPPSEVRLETSLSNQTRGWTPGDTAHPNRG